MAMQPNQRIFSKKRLKTFFFANHRQVVLRGHFFPFVSTLCHDVLHKLYAYVSFPQKLGEFKGSFIPSA
jgi:hypothetical protein